MIEWLRINNLVLSIFTACSINGHLEYSENNDQSEILDQVCAISETICHSSQPPGII